MQHKHRSNDSPSNMDTLPLTRATSPLSHHALKRLYARTSISENELLRRLNATWALKLTPLPGIPREHWLMYIDADDSFFVVIQDHIDGGIVTVLTEQYYINLLGPLSMESKSIAKQRVIDALESERLLRDVPPTEESKSTNLYVFINYLCAVNHYQKSMKLLRVPFADVQYSVEVGSQCPEVRKKIERALIEKGFPEKGEPIHFLFSQGQNRNKYKPIVLEYPL